jgi:Fe2+ or Zn2+ uptake regulation protein
MRRMLSSREMKIVVQPQSYDATIAGRGLRMTHQRRAVYDTLMGRADHPTAVEVFMRVKGQMPSISLATVYNCLETLVGCGLVRHVHHDRAPSRYCANLAEHAHLFCEGCGSVMDLPMRPRRRPEDVWEVPDNVIISQREVSFRGFCPVCAAQRSEAKNLPPKTTKKLKE